MTLTIPISASSQKIYNLIAVAENRLLKLKRGFMKIAVYDSYAKTDNGQLIHFDVLVKSCTPPEIAWQYGKDWLESIGNNPMSLKQSQCNYCHTEIATSKTQQIIEDKGYFILQMEGCPAPDITTN